MLRRVCGRLLAVMLILSGQLCAQESVPADTAAAQTGWAKKGLLPLPILFYTPETGWAVGASLLYVFRGHHADGRSRPSAEALTAIYTERKQFLVQLGGEWYLSDGIYKFEHNVILERFPAYFYGIGSGASDALKEAFTLQHTTLDLSANRRITSALSAGLVVHWEHVKMIERTVSGLLASGTVPGWDGGTVSALGAQLLWDTRDRIFSAASGQFHTLSFIRAGRTLGSDFTFSKAKFDLRFYAPIGSEQSVAIQTMGVFIEGTAPFRELGRLGGSSTLRGYYEGRYRDNHMLVGQAEFRTAVVGRFGAVMFAGAGTVARTIPAFELRAVCASAGIGVRYAFDPEERLNVRMDVGWGRNSSGVYVVASEAF